MEDHRAVVPQEALARVVVCGAGVDDDRLADVGRERELGVEQPLLRLRGRTWLITANRWCSRSARPISENLEVVMKTLNVRRSTVKLKKRRFLAVVLEKTAWRPSFPVFGRFDLLHDLDYAGTALDRLIEMKNQMRRVFEDDSARKLSLQRRAIFFELIQDALVLG